MIVLAYCAALRLGELGHLTVGDVDVPSGLLTVRNTKFFKSRSLSTRIIDAFAAHGFAGLQGVLLIRKPLSSGTKRDRVATRALRWQDYWCAHCGPLD